MTKPMPKMAKLFRQAGYTLIEILIVLFIISIVTTVALLSISRNENKQLESFANELTQMVTLAEEQAMLQPTVLGLTFSEHSFQFSSLDTSNRDEKKNKNTWIPLQDTRLAKRDIPSNIQLKIEVGNKSLSMDDEEENHSPQIIISTNGDITPFTIYVGQKGGKPRYVITGNADGNVTSKELP